MLLFWWPHCQWCQQALEFNTSRLTTSTMESTFGKTAILTQIVSIAHYPNVIGKQKLREQLQHATISQTRQVQMMSSLFQNCSFKAISVAIQRGYAGSSTTRPTITSNYTSIIRPIRSCHQITSALIIFKTTEIHTRDTSWKSTNWTQRTEIRLNTSQVYSFSRSTCTEAKMEGNQLSHMINFQMSTSWIKLLMDLFQVAFWSSTPQKPPSVGSTSWAGQLQLPASSELPSNRFPRPTSPIWPGTKMKDG